MSKILIHIGEGPGRETHEYQRGKLMNVEYMAMERETGLIGGDLEDALAKGGASALTALIWVLRKRTHHRLRFDEVTFEIGDVTIELVNDDGTPIEDTDEDQDESAAEPESEPEVPKAEPES